MGEKEGAKLRQGKNNKYALEVCRSVISLDTDERGNDCKVWR